MKTTKVLSVFLVLIMALSFIPFTAFAAENGELANGIKWQLGNDATLTISGSGELPDGLLDFELNADLWTWYDITSQAKKIVLSEGITRIGDSALSCCEQITEINLPQSLVSIGDNAFGQCWELNSIHIPKGVTEISPTAFPQLDSITIDSANPVYVVDEQGAVYNKDKTVLEFFPCNNNTVDFIVPSTVTTIGESAFEGGALRSIVIPESVIRIEDRAFLQIAIDTIHIPKSVTHIGFGALRASHYTKDITIDSANPSFIVENGIIFDRAKTKVVQCFKMEGFTSYAIPEGVVIIGAGAFMDCWSLQSVVIPSSVTTIEESAFDRCSLTSIQIPTSVTTIGERAFAANKIKELVVPGNIVRIEDGCFIANDDMTGLTIQEGVKEIGKGAFSGNDWLQIISVPSTLTAVEENAIDSCMIVQVNYPGTKKDAQVIDIQDGNDMFEEMIGGLTFKEKVSVFFDDVKDFFSEIGNEISGFFERIWWRIEELFL